MFRSMKDLSGFTIRATDGEIGTLDECYFDDRQWTVRYVVASTGGWFGPRVLLSPISIPRVDHENRTVEVSLTREQIRRSPEVDLARPVSRQYERLYSDYYAYAPYWAGPGYWGPGSLPAPLAAIPAARPQSRAAGREQDDLESHLRSSREVSGYHIHAIDGEVGHVDDFIVDDQSWAIRFLRVDTSNWPGGAAVLLAHEKVLAVSWRHAMITVSLTKDEVRNSPRFDSTQLNRERAEFFDELNPRARRSRSTSP